MLERIVGERLVLRRPRKDDAELMSKYAGKREIARWIPVMPHPYTRFQAFAFVRDCKKKWRNKESYQYAIEVKGEFAGMIGLHLKKDNGAELGYWIAKEYQGQGLTTDAARLIVREGFKRLKLHKIYARYMDGNEGSKRVMEKLGMTYEGTLRKQVLRFGRYYDEVCYGILRSEFR